MRVTGMSEPAVPTALVAASVTRRGWGWGKAGQSVLPVLTVLAAIVAAWRRRFWPMRCQAGAAYHQVRNQSSVPTVIQMAGAWPMTTSRMSSSVALSASISSVMPQSANRLDARTNCASSRRRNTRRWNGAGAMSRQLAATPSTRPTT